MKHSEAMKVKVGDLLAINRLVDGVLWEVADIKFPIFFTKEAGTDYRPQGIDYCCFSRPTQAQLKAYTKRKEKYYAAS